MINVSIIGASGYTGSELIRILVNHPEVALQDLTARALADTKISYTFPALTPFLGDKTFVELDLERMKENSDLVFICLPHGHAMNIGKELYTAGLKVIDLGADFRLRDIDTFEEYYETTHTASEFIEQAVYGLTEFYREQVKDAGLIANPGCFVTTALLGLTPLVEAQVVNPKSIVIDAKSGVSGAGRGENVDNLLSELANNFKAYNPLAHRHIPEIEQELSRFGEEVIVQFTPHLLPTERGIFATIYAEPKEEISEEDLRQIFQNAYENEPFVHLLDEGVLPALKAVRGTNQTYIQVKKDTRTGRILVFAVLDNLLKGASGQAVQNMNVMYGFDEMLGLTQVGLMP